MESTSHSTGRITFSLNGSNGSYSDHHTKSVSAKHVAKKVLCSLLSKSHWLGLKVVIIYSKPTPSWLYSRYQENSAILRETKTFPQMKKKYDRWDKVPQHLPLSYFFIAHKLHFAKLFMNVIFDQERLYESDIL